MNIIDKRKPEEVEKFKTLVTEAIIGNTEKGGDLYLSTNQGNILLPSGVGITADQASRLAGEIVDNLVNKTENCECSNCKPTDDTAYNAAGEAVAIKAPLFLIKKIESLVESKEENDVVLLFNDIKKTFTPDEIAYLATKELARSMKKSVKYAMSMGLGKTN